MNVTQLIDALRSLCDAPRPEMASIGEKGRTDYVYIFGNSQGYPAIQLTDEVPPFPIKTCTVLVRELNTWKRESSHYREESDVYLFVKFDYPDQSYDFRHFKLTKVLLSDDSIMLISEVEECLQLRQHFDAFDDDMLDDSDDD